MFLIPYDMTLELAHNQHETCVSANFMFFCSVNHIMRERERERERVYLFIQEYKPQRQWNWKGQNIWEFKSSRRLLGSPMMDAIHEGTTVNKEMMDWLKRRTRAFRVPWKDHQ
jgi:hypothetical protein